MWTLLSLYLSLELIQICQIITMISNHYLIKIIINNYSLLNFIIRSNFINGILHSLLILKFFNHLKKINCLLLVKITKVENIPMNPGKINTIYKPITNLKDQVLIISKSLINSYNVIHTCKTKTSHYKSNFKSH